MLWIANDPFNSPMGLRRRSTQRRAGADGSGQGRYRATAAVPALVTACKPKGHAARGRAGAGVTGIQRGAGATTPGGGVIMICANPSLRAMRRTEPLESRKVAETSRTVGSEERRVMGPGAGAPGLRVEGSWITCRSTVLPTGMPGPGGEETEMEGGAKMMPI